MAVGLGLIWWNWNVFDILLNILTREKAPQLLPRFQEEAFYDILLTDVNFHTRRTQRERYWSWEKLLKSVFAFGFLVLIINLVSFVWPKLRTHQRSVPWSSLAFININQSKEKHNLAKYMEKWLVAIEFLPTVRLQQELSESSSHQLKT